MAQKTLKTLLFISLAFAATAQQKIYYNSVNQEVKATDDFKTFDEIFEKSGDSALVKTYFADGKISSQGVFLKYRTKKQERLGVHTAYYRDTNLVYLKMYYEQGRMVERRGFFKSGQVKRVEKFDAEGKVADGKCFNEDGSARTFTPHEKMPEFPGGEQAMLQFLVENIKYPKLARENGIQGRVVVQFVVEKDGSLSNLVILKDIGAGCGEEAVRVVSMMPRWSPGMQDDHPVRVKFWLPIKFGLEGGKKKKKKKKSED